MPNDFDFFYDLGSPYSYLASTQLAGIEQRTGSSARLLPITLGGLRKATGHHLPPPQQLKYMSEDTARWAQQYGVKMQIPRAFPASTIQALRACVASERSGKGKQAMHALFRAYWAEGEDVSDASVIERALAAAVAGQPPHPSQAPWSEPEEQADGSDSEADAHQQLPGVRAHPAPQAFRPSPLRPRSMLR